MEHYGRELAFVLFIIVLFGGLAAYGLITGTLPSRSGLLKRSSSPAAYYAGVIIYTSIALAASCGALDLILLMNHCKGLW
jgi:hypothetical protein